MIKLVKKIVFSTSFLFIFLVLVFTIPGKASANTQDNYTFIPISQFANGEIIPRYKNLPLGINSFAGIPFEIIQEPNPKYICTSAQPIPNFPNEITLNTIIKYPKSVYLLINGGNVSKNLLNSNVGQIKLHFSDGSFLPTEIIIGFNLRDWILNDKNYVHATNDPNITEAWNGTTLQGNGPVIIDLLKIPIPLSLNCKTLTKIELIDNSISTINNLDPSIQFFGVTVETNQTPIILIPGLGSSWNLQALLTGQTVGPWTKTPFLKVYNNFKATLIDSAGYVEGDNYFEFYYDWRKPLSDLADDLNEYIENVVFSGQSVNLVGHSMGGLVARAYANKYGIDKVEKIVTVGSPHLGALASYYAWEGGQLEDDKSWLVLPPTILINTTRRTSETPREIVHDFFPSLKDLLPIFSCLKRLKGTLVDVDSMIEQNSYLKGLLDPLLLKEKLVTIYGKENNPEDTPEYYIIKEQSFMDKLLGHWTDGVPVNKEYTFDGDLTVLTKSATVSGSLSSHGVSGDHSQIIENEKGISQILSSLGIEGVSIIQDEFSPPRNPSLVLLIHSPVEIKINCPDGEVGYNVASPISRAFYSSQDKLIIIPEALGGNYQVEILGTGNGEYNLEVAQFTNNGNQWQTIGGKINPGQTVNMDLYFNPSSPQENILKDNTGQLYLTLAKERLESLSDYLNTNIEPISLKNRLQIQIRNINRGIDRGLTYISLNNNYYSSRYTFSSFVSIYGLRQSFNQYFKSRDISKETSAYFRNELEEIAKLLEAGWLTTFQNAGKSINEFQVNYYETAINKLYNQIKIMVEAKSNKGENKKLGSTWLLLEQKKAKESQFKNNQSYSKAYINLVSERLLLLESLRLLY
ncbi:hypothetical protein COT75_00045 [Candidatus Beckwithbacteria bacterium CG10_big_fil_rev_8_21_14_0_10_34_10]|uniref:GPI inositol-deacylase PGAP1-like alpha/beta domain-containing protein n=1 Tax=Candidatus Beckwithbacteria bacterium CG10_big_fil_rev_8_21_14_0_10_34_10 TaxID=1974495 RepID=A0A2H0WAJ7_9BACT|nr:MAG: hypothetical protein COT75_00045 [Candidatus Beckwithbacteria bacterium CG10_big_fil_rev_8_21_14_0_10_34_10]